MGEQESKAENGEKTNVSRKPLLLLGLEARQEEGVLTSKAHSVWWDPNTMLKADWLKLEPTGGLFEGLERTVPVRDITQDRGGGDTLQILPSSPPPANPCLMLPQATPLA